ncbi:MAG: hypothetical protein ACK4RF_01895, partial [Cyclobacteriaceae bacterium]
YLLILLFSFETTAPVFSEISVKHTETTCCISLKAEVKPSDWISLIFLTESGAEERIEKGTLATDSFFLEIFNALIKFKPFRITWPLPEEKFSSQPSLFTRYRTLLI